MRLWFYPCLCLGGGGGGAGGASVYASVNGRQVPCADDVAARRECVQTLWGSLWFVLSFVLLLLLLLLLLVMVMLVLVLMLMLMLMLLRLLDKAVVDPLAAPCRTVGFQQRPLSVSFSSLKPPRVHRPVRVTQNP